MKLHIADEARCDIRRIAAYYKKVSGSTRWFLDQVDRAIDHLKKFPKSGHRRDDLRNENLRCWMIVPYVIIYRVDADTPVIVAYCIPHATGHA